jgi:hypothetical protein
MMTRRKRIKGRRMSRKIIRRRKRIRRMRRKKRIMRRRKIIRRIMRRRKRIRRMRRRTRRRMKRIRSRRMRRSRMRRRMRRTTNYKAHCTLLSAILLISLPSVQTSSLYLFYISLDAFCSLTAGDQVSHPHSMKCLVYD